MRTVDESIKEKLKSSQTKKMRAMKLLYLEVAKLELKSVGDILTEYATGRFSRGKKKVVKKSHVTTTRPGPNPAPTAAIAANATDANLLVVDDFKVTCLSSALPIGREGVARGGE